MLGVSMTNMSDFLKDDELENEEEEEEEEEEEVHPLPSFLKTELPQLLTTKRPSCIRLNLLTKAEEEPSPTSALTVLKDSVEETSSETTKKNTVKTSTTSQVFFMIGCQRSGSNWLRTMLSEREDLIAPHPPHIMRDFMPKLVTYGCLSDQKNLKVSVLCS